MKTFDIETIGNIRDMRRLEVVLGNVGGDLYHCLPEVMSKDISLSMIDHLSNGVPIVTYNGTHFDFKVLSYQECVAVDEIVSLCRSHYDMFLNVQFFTGKIPSLSNVMDAYGRKKGDGSSISRMFEGARYDDIVSYSVNEQESFEDIVSSWMETGVVCWMKGGRFFRETVDVVTVEEIMNRDISGRLAYRYEWMGEV